MALPAETQRDPHWVARRNFQAEVAELAVFYFGRVPLRWQLYLEDLLAADVDEAGAKPRFLHRGAVEVRAALWGFVLASVVFAIGLAIGLEVL